MSKFVGALVGVVEIVAGAVLDYFSFGTIGNGLIITGIGTLLGAAAQLLISPHRAPVQPIDVNYSGTLEPRRIIYGKMKVGGMHVIPPLTSGNNNDYLHLALAIAGHPITGFGDAYLGQVRIANGDIAAVTGTVNDGLVSNAITNNGYQGKVWIRRYNGSQTNVDYILNTTFTVWDSNHKGQGIPYMAVQYQYDQKVFASGLPEPSVIVLGKAVYDPRLDSTNGGSGSQRYNTPSTWAYSTNPALCLRDYLTSALGLSAPQTAIDDSLVAAAANICDQTVTVPIPVLVGITNWTSGSAIVIGSNTAFMAQGGLNNGVFTGSAPNFTPASTTYVKAPNGSMLQVQSVQSDTQFTLTANYAGATANSQITQWNNSTATTTTQARYSCNTVLDCTTRYEDNIAQLARSMMGQCIYSSGKWRMYAGAWSGTAFSLAETDLVGGVSIQTATPRQSLYNAVRGNFISPQKNYQPDEFPPVINTSFATSDGETIYTETNFPCCTDIFECQRNANLLLNFSRDQKIVTAQYGMSAFGVRVWETGTVTIAEVGWIGQTVRCIGWRFNPGGIVELTLQEAYAADWTDPLSTFYVTSGTLIANQPGYYLPYPATALTTLPVPGGIQFTLTLPLQVVPGTRIGLWEYTANTPFSSASLVWVGSATTFVLAKDDIVTRYYWVTTLGPNGQVSTSYPASTGVAGVALAPLSQVWMPWVAVGVCTASDTNAYKQGGSSAWDSCVYSVRGYSVCHVSAKTNAIGDATHEVMIGLSVSPTASPSYTNANYAWYTGVDGNWYIYESGSNVAGAGPTALSDVATVTYDGATITYYLNGIVKRTVAISNLTLYGFVPIKFPGNGVNSLGFGPTTNLAIVDTPQIGSNAATDVSSTSVSSVTITNVEHSPDGQGFNTQIASVSYTAPNACTVRVTASAYVSYTVGSPAGVFADFRYSIQQDSAYNNVQEWFLGSPTAGGNYAQNITTSRTYTMTAGQASTFKFMGSKFQSGDTVTANNIEMVIEVVKR
jgi:hypothetical protein